MNSFIRIHPADNVAVALSPVAAGTVFEGVTAQEEIPQGHKMALRAIPAGQNVVKYGFAIGHATEDIAPGAWVHVHNTKTNLSEDGDYTYDCQAEAVTPIAPATFQGFVRADGRAAVRNEIWVIPHRGLCQRHCAEAVPRQRASGKRKLGGLVCFPASVWMQPNGRRPCPNQKAAGGFGASS